MNPLPSSSPSPIKRSPLPTLRECRDLAGYTIAFVAIAAAVVGISYGYALSVASLIDKVGVKPTLFFIVASTVALVFAITYSPKLCPT